jgi:hypothetical protein
MVRNLWGGSLKVVLAEEPAVCCAVAALPDVVSCVLLLMLSQGRASTEELL